MDLHHFTGMLIVWVVLNTIVLMRFGASFDPYPYIFLNLILSMVAALQAPVILMSQSPSGKFSLGCIAFAT